MMGTEEMERLERLGFAAHRAAAELAEVRLRFPGDDDLARRAALVETEARIVAGTVASILRAAEEAGWDRR